MSVNKYLKNRVARKGKFFSKKNVILLFSMTSTLALVPVAVSVAQVVQNTSRIGFDGKTFSNQQNLVDYIKNNSEKTNYYTEGNNSTWTATINGKAYTFNSPEELQKSLISKIGASITTQTYVTSRTDENLSKFIDPITGEIFDNDNFYGMFDLKSSSVNNAKKETLYQGANDSVHYDDKEKNIDGRQQAKNSYYHEQNAYQFNGLYFENKEDLRSYLKTEYLQNTNNSAVESVVILEAPNGVKSSPINLKDNSALNYIKSFIQNNAGQVVQYKGSHGQNINLTKSNLQQNYNNISINDLQYLHVKSNQGESRYVIDNSIEDDHNLIGPYFYQGNLDVGAFTNKYMWKKTTGVTNQVWQESKVDTVIGQFFSSIINDDNALNIAESQQDNVVPTIFRTILAGSDKNVGLDREYLNKLNELEPFVYKQVVEANQNLMQGKKYNTFYKIPVMYSFILQRLVRVNAGNEIINLTIDYFSKVCDYIQSSIESVVLDQKLLIGKNNKKFNVKELFQIGNQEFDTNTNVEYFMNEIKQYPNLVTAMVVYIEAVNNINTMAGLIKFEGNDNNFLFDFKLIDGKDWAINYDAFKNIYNTFSSINYSNGFVKEFVNKSTLPEVVNIKNTMPADQWEQALLEVKMSNDISLGAYLTTVTAKNTLDYLVSKNALEAEIEKYIANKEIVDGGLLEQLGPTVDSFIAGAYNNKDVDVYQAYLVLLADLRDSSLSKMFNNNSAIADKLNFARNVINFGTITMATSAMVTNTINNLYWKFHNWFTFDGKTISPPSFKKTFSSVRKAAKKTYDTIDGALLSLKNKTKQWSYDISNKLEKINIFDPSKISSYKFFSKIDKVVDILKKGAPILGAAFAIFEIAMLFYDLFSETITPVYYVYTTSDGTQFIWDGGQIVSKFFGFDVRETATITDMKLLNPVQFNLPQIEEFYYYNQVKYYSPSELKVDQLDYIFSSDYKNENTKFVKKLTFSSSSVIQEWELVNTIEELTSKVLNSIGIVVDQEGNITSNNVNKQSPYISNSSYAFTNGLVTNYDGAIDTIANKIVGNIRATKFVKLPVMTNGKVDSSKTIINNETTKVIPGKVWKNSKIIDNSNLISQYLVNNSANETNEEITDWSTISEDKFKTKDITTAESQASTQIKALFNNTINVDSKQVLSIDITLNEQVQNKEYSKISSDSRTINIYTVNIPGKTIASFIDQGKAFNYLSKFANIKKNVDRQVSTSYKYGDLYFASESELYNFVKQLA